MIKGVWAFREHARPHLALLAGGAVLTALEVAVALAKPWPLRYLVDSVLAPESGVRPDDPQTKVVIAVAVLAAIVIVGAAITYGASRMLSTAGLRIASSLRVTVLQRLHRLPLGYHSERRVGDLVSRVTSDVNYVQDMIVQSLSTLLPSLLLVIGMFAVMVTLSPMFTLLGVLATPPLVLATHKSRQQLRLASRRARKADGAIASAATEDLSAIHLLQAFTLEEQRISHFGDLCGRSLDAGTDAVRLESRFGPMVEVAGVVSTALVLWFGSNLVLADDLTVGVMLVFMSYMGSLFKPVKSLSKLSNVVSKGAAAAERIDEVMSAPLGIENGPDAHARRVDGSVEFRGVSFSYGREPVLDRVWLNIPAGSTVALVGPTGAGKSTLAALIPRLLDVDDGQVLVDGVDVREHEIYFLRRQIATVLQDTVLLEGTLRDNLVCGRPDASSADVERASRLALVDEFATRLPDGLDTKVGERGANLSGGQRQRVAIARAILRDASIIILDEPTSALDAASEELLVAALDNLPAERTKLIIAHRLSTVRNADVIAVMVAGRITELGTHDELMTSGGLYHRMASYQTTANQLSHIDTRPSSQHRSQVGQFDPKVSSDRDRASLS